MLSTSHGLGISARAHVQTALLHLRNGLTDCVQIWYVGWRSLSKCFPQVMGGVGYLCTCARAPPSPYLRIRVANCAKIRCVARDPIVTRFTRVGGGVTTFARACPVSLSRKPLSPGTEATSKTDLSVSRSLVHRQTWRLTRTNLYELIGTYRNLTINPQTVRSVLASSFFASANHLAVAMTTRHSTPSRQLLAAGGGGGRLLN